MDDTMCGGGYDTLHVFQCQFSLAYPFTEIPVRCPQSLDGLLHVVLGNLPHLPPRVREVVVDGLDHKHTAEDAGHPAVPDNRVVADSADTFNLQPCSVTVEKMDYLHVKRFLHRVVGSLRHDCNLGCEQGSRILHWYDRTIIWQMELSDEVEQDFLLGFHILEESTLAMQFKVKANVC